MRIPGRMVDWVCAGPYATQSRQPRQVRKEATATGHYGRSRSPGTFLNAVVGCWLLVDGGWTGFPPLNNLSVFWRAAREGCLLLRERDGKTSNGKGKSRFLRYAAE